MHASAVPSAPKCKRSERKVKRTNELGSGAGEQTPPINRTIEMELSDGQQQSGEANGRADGGATALTARAPQRSVVQHTSDPAGILSAHTQHIAPSLTAYACFIVYCVLFFFFFMACLMNSNRYLAESVHVGAKIILMPASPASAALSAIG
jgi:hypothetical protein